MFGLLPPSSRVTGMRFSAGVLHDQPAGRGLAGERDLARSALLEASGLPASTPKPLTMLSTPGGSRSAISSISSMDRGRGLLGRLEHDRVAGGQRRGQLPDRHQDREVPRDDLPDDAERLVEVVGDGVVVDLRRASPPGRGSRRRSSGSGRWPAGCRRPASRGPACRCPRSRRPRASRGSPPSGRRSCCRMLARSVDRGLAPGRRGGVRGVQRELDVLGGAAGDLA